MYEKITGINPYEVPMLISPSAHFTMGGLWVDYEMQTSIPGLFAIGEANFSDHGANRLGANSLLQACVDGYFILPVTIGNYLSNEIHSGKVDTNGPSFEATEAEVISRIERLLAVKGNTSAEQFHKRLGKLMWDNVGLERSRESLEKAIEELKVLRKDFWENINVPGTDKGINSELEKAERVADYIELASTMTYDALRRNESCGAHFRTEFQTEEGEAMRNDDEYQYVSVWEFNGVDKEPILHKEPLVFEVLQPTVRSYK
jgi:succinate dehydrogenase / fumarate reductase flavoprotein subunit